MNGADYEDPARLDSDNETEEMMGDQKLDGNANISTNSKGDQDTAASTGSEAPASEEAIHPSAASRLETSSDLPIEAPGPPAPERATGHGSIALFCDGYCGY